MRAYILLALCAVTLTATANTKGIDAILNRRKTMTKLEHRVIAQRIVDGNIMSVYDNDTMTTQAVRIVRMSTDTKARVAQLIDDKATLKAARQLASRVRASHASAAGTLSDPDLLAVTDDVFDTAAKGNGNGKAGALGAALGAAFGVAFGKIQQKGKKS